MEREETPYCVDEVDEEAERSVSGDVPDLAEKSAGSCRILKKWLEDVNVLMNFAEGGWP
jgi:hypothetical protein